MSCETQSRVVAVPVVVEPVPVLHHLVTVLVEVRDIEVAVGVANRLYQVPSGSPPLVAKTGRLEIEFYPAS